MKLLKMDYPADTLRIQQIIQSHGFICNLWEAKTLWETFSESMAAGWMTPYEDDEAVWSAVAPYINELTDFEYSLVEFLK
jgi:hypothetical protein